MKLYAHRGSSGTHPENTLAAFQAAAGLDIAGVELDVHFTKDGEAVVIHDETVDRTTDGTGYVKDYTLKELKKLDCGSWFSAAWEGERIPTLDEVLDIFEGTHHELNVELKTDIFPYEGLVAYVLRRLQKRGMIDRAVLSSFNHEDVQKVCLLRTTAEAAILTAETMVDVYDYARVIGTKRLHVSVPSAFRKMTKEALRKGALVYVYTVNEIEEAEKLQQIGVHGLFTDYPERFHEYFMEKEAH